MSACPSQKRFGEAVLRKTANLGREGINYGTSPAIPLPWPPHPTPGRTSLSAPGVSLSVSSISGVATAPSYASLVLKMRLLPSVWTKTSCSAARSPAASESSSAADLEALGVQNRRKVHDLARIGRRHERDLLVEPDVIRIAE